jgi:serine/threonine-protein kinase
MYGLEESDGTRALVMELVDGPTIADRLKQGAIPIEDALPIAKQIADALEYAHERGIIHRDLKPANIKIKSDGTVKVLDFGLAKALADDPAAQDISTSPTLSIAATRAGFIIGTAAYMAPEQARGKSVDRRADIWSFGVVLYEMLTGKLCFQGETISDTLAGVIRAEPEWSALPANLPPTIRQLLQRCLRKDVKTRLQSIGDARVTLDEFLANPAALTSTSEFPAPAVVSAQPFWRTAIPWFAVAILAVIAALAAWRPWQAMPNPGVIRLTTDFGGEGSLYADYGTAAFISPDGTRIVYVEKDAHGARQLYVRALDQLQGAPLAGTEGARNPFFSPDGQWLGFFTNDKLKKISLQGGATIVLCNIQDDRGGAWGEDGSIVFAPNTRAGLSRISTNGGKVEAFSQLDEKSGELTHRWPQFLPGGKDVLYTSSNDGNDYEDSDVVVQVIATGQKKKLLHGGYYPRYLSSGHIVFLHEGTLFATPFDLSRLEITGEPVPVLDHVVGNLSNGGGQFSVSQSGLFVYLSGKGARERLEVDWLTEDGKFVPLRKELAAYWGISFSPDGKLLALGLEDGKRQDIWVDDWQRGTIRRLTFTGAENFYPAWTPDGKHISFASNGEGGNASISWRNADGSGDAQELVKGNFRYGPMSWRPDGKVLVYSQRNTKGEWNLFTVAFQDDGKNGLIAGAPKPLLDNDPMGLAGRFRRTDAGWRTRATNRA